MQINSKSIKYWLMRLKRKMKEKKLKDRFKKKEKRRARPNESTLKSPNLTPCPTWGLKLTRVGVAMTWPDWFDMFKSNPNNWYDNKNRHL